MFQISNSNEKNLLHVKEENKVDSLLALLGVNVQKFLADFNIFLNETGT